MALLSGTLTSAADLLAHLDRVRVLDCRTGPGARERYLERHIAGALYVDLERDLSVPRPDAVGGRHPLPPIEAFAATLGRLGIDPATPVVLYDDKAGANAAARAWWMLRAIDHDDVAVLDGGVDAAEEAGVPFASGEEHAPEKPPYPVERWVRPTVSIDEVERLAADPAYRVIDVRAAERYRGESEPIDPVAGHVPGAHNLPLTESLEGEAFKPRDELAALFAQRLAGVPPERVIVSCGSGVTACHTLLALEHAGLAGARLYVGSWSEWCRSGRPQAKGPSPR